MKIHNRAAILQIATDIVSAFVSNNVLRIEEVPGLIEAVHGKFDKLNDPPPPPSAPAALIPAVSVKKSVTSDFLICLEDGRKYKSLRRHLKTAYGMTPEDYRAKWGLPHDYPMVAPGYAATRSELAKRAGLGGRRKRATPVDPPSPPPAAKPARKTAPADAPSAPASAARRRRTKT